MRTFSKRSRIFIFSSKSELQIDAALIFAGSDFVSAPVYSSLRQDITAF